MDLKEKSLSELREKHDAKLADLIRKKASNEEINKFMLRAEREERAVIMVSEALVKANKRKGLSSETKKIMEEARARLKKKHGKR